MRVSARPVLTAAWLRVEWLASRPVRALGRARVARKFALELASVARCGGVPGRDRGRGPGSRSGIFRILPVNHEYFPYVLYRERSGSLAKGFHENTPLAALRSEYAHFDEFVRLEAPVDFHHDIVGQTFGADKDHRHQFVRERLQFAAPPRRQSVLHTANSSL